MPGLLLLLAAATSAPSPAVAQGEPAANRADPDAEFDIPCARYVGQPMTRCRAAVVRKGPADADISVAWPDGGVRILRFRAGKPESADSRGEFRYTREAELNMIRVGPAERFEILDAIPLGD